MTAESEQRAAVVAEARSWLRTPYHHHAAVKGAGVDCALLLIEVYAATGLAPRLDVGDYPPDWMLHRGEERYLGWVERYAREVAAPLPGDIALFRFGRCFSHAAIVLDDPAILHAYRPAGSVVLDDRCANADLVAREVRFFSLWGA